ncbi:MAG TPA: class I SAM-dependent methyltransferase [Thermoleophilaceae bacterium]|nr:class I SAM-dependent methyltransferase [Thermoleophilaceae bacterium]
MARLQGAVGDDPATDPEPAAAFDPAEYWESRHELPGLAAVGHLRLGEPFNRWAYRARRRAFLRAVRPFLSDGPPARVLDVGSGKGFYVERWRELGARAVTGCDLSQGAVGELRARFPESEFMQLDIGAPLDDDLAGRFDAVSAFDVVFHIVDDLAYRRAFENAAKLLRPGGLLIFSEYLMEGRTRRAEAWVKRSRGEIEAAVHDAGLEELSRRPMFFLMNPPAEAGLTLHRRAWRALAQAIRRHPRLGGVAGALLYPPEVALTRFSSKGPSTEIVVCRKPG